MTDQHRLAAAALAAFAAAMAIPLALAQLDFAGVVDVFGIDSGDVSSALRVLAGVGGFLTFAVVIATAAGAALVFLDPAAAQPVLVAAAVAGFLTATVFWIPAGVAIGAAAALLRGGAEAAPQGGTRA